jgi:hypothetical protein
MRDGVIRAWKYNDQLDQYPPVESLLSVTDSRLPGLHRLHSEADRPPDGKFCGVPGVKGWR